MVNTNKVMFLHIPKSGGSTLLSLFQDKYSTSEMLVMYDVKHNQPLLFKYQFADIPKRRVDSAKFIIGHFGYGVHETMPKESDNWSYITMLRDPVKRVFSDYLHLQRVDRWPECKEIKKMTFGDFLRSGIWTDADNGQVRRLCGAENELNKIPFGKVSNIHLDLSLQNIKNKFIYVGLMEDFNNSVNHIGRILGWRDSYYYRANEKPNSQLAAKPSESDIELCKSLNQYDIELYESIKLNNISTDPVPSAFDIHGGEKTDTIGRLRFLGKSKVRRYMRAIKKRIRLSVCPY